MFPLLSAGSLLRGSLALSLAVPTGLTIGPRPALAMTAASEEEPPPADAQASSDSNEHPAIAEPAESTPTPPPAEGTPPTSATPSSPCLDGITWNAGATVPPSPELLAKNRRLAAEDRKTDRMLIASYVLLSIGGSLLLGSAGAIYGGSQLRTDEDPNAGSTARGVGYGTLAFSLASVGTGITLMAVGFARRKQARNGTLVAGTPVVTPGFAGASLRVRF